MTDGLSNSPSNPTTGFDISAHLDDVTEMVIAASNRSLDWYRRIDDVDNKASTGFDPVTEADRAIEADLRERLGARFPDHAILGEEFGTTGSGPYRRPAAGHCRTR